MKVRTAAAAGDAIRGLLCCIRARLQSCRERRTKCVSASAPEEHFMEALRKLIPYPVACPAPQSPLYRLIFVNLYSIPTEIAKLISFCVIKGA